MNRVLLLTALLLAPLPALAGVFEHPADAAELARTLAPATSALASAQSLHGRYRQTKQLAGLPAPLISEGEFLVARTLGIAWRTEKPFAAELLITPDALVQRSASGEQRIDAAAQPAVRAIAAVFFAVFALDFGTLSTMFEPYAVREGDGRWALGLLPRERLGAIESIEIRGDTSVTQVILREQGGDSTRIDLTETRISTALAESDRVRFERR
ncbi:MAG: outer membrane lipoprotein carrier protein LolA [Gammaproteobacteria bacterium]